MKQSVLKSVISVLAILFSIFVGTNAQVKLPRLVSNGMVLQRDAPVKIWGWAGASEKVTVLFLEKKYVTKADKQGNWSVILPATAAGGPYTLKINDIELTDILMGDVWVCSGQSNMELPIRRVMDLYESEILKTNNPQIRQFRCSSRNDFEMPQTDYKDGAWLPATQANILDFSAVAYFFASQLFAKYQVPIGLIQTAIGGSPAESWVSSDYNQKYLDSWKAQNAKLDSMRLKKIQDGTDKPFNFFAELNQNDPGVSKWSRAEVDASQWPVMSVPGYWTDKGVDLRMGSMWFYREFSIPDSLTSKEAILRLGRIIDSDSAFVNGTFVGTVGYQYPPRIYKIPAAILKPGVNKLMVRVISQGWRGGFVEEKPYEVRIGTQKIDLTGDWSYHIGAIVTPPAGQVGGPMQFMPGGLFNGLISPTLNFTNKGVIWYQGESNISNNKWKDYRPLFKNLINDWRKQYRYPEMPFLFVQLANLGVPSKQTYNSEWSEVRDAQRRALELPKTGMAVAYDLGEWNDIHPLNKKEVGRRLALEAMQVAYGDSTVVSSGPLYSKMEIAGNSAYLTFTSVGSGLYANNLLDGFQVAGADGKFVWANAVVLTKNKVRVWSNQVPNPVAVRYAWDDNPAGANLKNKEGLPASPFTTME